MNLDVALLPRDLDPATLGSRAVAVFDVLRATSTMTAALAAGVAAIHICPDVPAARAHAQTLAPAPLLCGEERCLAPAGFDLGNSPGAFDAAHAGRSLVMCTTNGTRAILAARGAGLLLVGALVNAAAVARALHQSNLDVTLLCAGTNGQVALEDALGAGAVIDALERLATIDRLNDSAQIARRLFACSRHDLRATMAGGAGGRNVIAANLEPDIDFAAALDRFDVVGQVEDLTVRPLPAAR